MKFAVRSLLEPPNLVVFVLTLMLASAAAGRFGLSAVDVVVIAVMAAVAADGLRHMV